MKLHILSGGAANGIVAAVAGEFRRTSGAEIDGTFGAVGAMREKLIGGTPADLLILTKAMIAGLEKDGYVVSGTARDIGAVPTSVAVRKGDPRPNVEAAGHLNAALLEADSLYVPDTKQSTAGIHIAGMLKSLGIDQEMAPKLREFPNGNTAMKALAEAKTPHPIGCTQRTEILATPGVTLVADLPPGCGLATIYTAAVAAAAQAPELAMKLIALLTSADTAERRRIAGFDAV